MKKLVSSLVVVMLFGSLAFADAVFDEFKSGITGYANSVIQTRLDSFAKDLGVLLGGGSFHQGKSLGFPGFDVGIHVPFVKVKNEDVLMNANLLALPILQAEIGLPAKFDLIARYATDNNSSFIGMGLRYGIINNSLPGLPSLSIQAVSNTLNVNAGVNKLKATTMSAACIFSINLPIITPFAGVGIDNTEVTPDSTITKLIGKSSSMRFEVGANLTLFPFTYIQFGGVLVNGDINPSAGFGIKF